MFIIDSGSSAWSDPLNGQIPIHSHFFHSKSGIQTPIIDPPHLGFPLFLIFPNADPIFCD